MDVFKLGLRTILGIILPGAILVMAFLYGVWNFTYILIQPKDSFSWSEIQLFLSFIPLFIISYLLGNWMRLEAADKIDKKSSKYLLKGHVQPGSANEKELENAKRELTTKKDYENVNIPKGFDQWIFRREEFPYPLWELRKFQIYHPREVFNFFKSYRDCMVNPEKQGSKEFFNYCKMVILDSDKQSLKEEVQYAEGITRFFAGTYTALQYSSWILLLSALITFTFLYISLFTDKAFTSYNLSVHVFIPFLLALAMYFMNQKIIHRFRLLRLKEVDTVYEAFYLVHRHINHCKICSEYNNALNDNKFRKRQELIDDAFKNSQLSENALSPVSLEKLILFMKDKSKSEEYLSSIYFAGKEGDHPYFLQNDKIAIGLSVLPEDAKKSGKRKSHPHQEEAIIVLNGSILLEIDKNGKATQKVLNQGDMFVINKSQCHHILPIDDKDAAYIFVKTNPAEEPRAIDC